MDSISGIRDFGAHLQENAYHRALDVASSLQAGEVLEVEVVEVLGKNLAVLDIRGSTVLAEIPDALTAGTSVRTLVQEVSPKLILVLLREGSASSGSAQTFLRSHLPDKVPLSKLIPQLVQDLPALQNHSPALAKSLHSLLDSVVLSPKTIQNADYLKTWLKGSGLLLESRLAEAVHQSESPDLRFDLKATLLRLAEELKSGQERSGKADPSVVHLLNNIRTYIKNIELEQFRNVNAFEDGRSVHLQLPWGTEGERAELFFYQENKDRDEDKSDKKDGFRVCFLLHLQGLGDLRIDALLQESRVGFRFEVTNPESASLFQKHFARLKGRVETQGFQVTRMECVEVEKTPHKNEEDVESNFGLQNQRLIDIKA
jgi:hypothetical protein